MSALKKEKDALAARMRSLQTRSEELEDRIRKLDSATALWKVLPQELWPRIFEFVQDGERIRLAIFQRDNLDIGVTKDTFPERVCFLWRQIALRSTSLYATVEVNYSELEEKAEGDELTEHAAEVIVRGTSHLYLDFEYVDAKSAKGYLQTLLSTSASRLESLEISHYNSDVDLLDAVSSSIPTLPLLKHFKDNLQNGSESVDELWLSLSDIANGTYWRQITNLNIGGRDSSVNIRPIAFIRLLCLCPQMTECELGLRRAEEDTLLPLPLITGGHITHSKLKSLKLHFKGGWSEGISAVFDALILPTLENISLRVHAGMVHPTDILSLLNRSRCTLLSLHLSSRSISEADLDLLLSGLPSVIRISIKAKFMTPNVLDKISKAELLPKLVELKGVLVGNLRDIDALKGVAESRWEGKNGSDIQIIDFGYYQVQGWTPPELTTEWKEKFQADRRWVVHPVHWIVDH